MRKIVIIHASTIVCRGLANVLKGYFNLDILTYASSKEFISLAPKINECIVFIDPTEQKQINRIQALKSINDIKIICLYNHIDEVENVSYDNKISLAAEPVAFYHLVEPLCQKAKNSSTKNENNGLTIRETDVLRKVAKGLTNKEIADALFISVHTVISHRKNITSKLGIRSISGLTVYAIINNLVDTQNIDPKSLI